MELEKGVCFSCDDKKLILNRCSETIQQIFLHLYTETVLNVEKLQNITPSLKLCPVCHHKLILLERIYEHIEANQSQDENENCTLCKKGDFIFKISKWNYFKDISDDFPVFSNKNKYDVCSQCCFYLDSRHILKKRLFSKYPQLRIVPKLKLKFGSEITSHSTPLATKKRDRLPHRKRSSSEVIFVTSDTEISSEAPKGLDLSLVKSFKVLRNNSSLRRSKIVSKDPKLLNQILYVKISRNNFRSDQKSLSEDVQKENHVETLPKTPLKKTALRNQKIDSKAHPKINESKLDEKDSEQLEKSPESITISKTDTGYEASEDSLSTKKQPYFKIKLKKQTTRTNKSNKKEYRDDRINSETTDIFTKALVINLEKKTLLPTAANTNTEKSIENGEDNVSMEVTEPEDKCQTESESLRMEVDETDNSKHEISSEEKISLRITEDKELDITNGENEQVREKSTEEDPERSEKTSISEVVEKLDSEDKTEKDYENNDEKKSKNEVSENKCDRSIPEIKEPTHCEDEKLNSDEEKTSKADDEKEKSSVEETTTRRKSVVSDDEDKGDDISDKEGQSQVPANGEESCNGKSAEDLEDVCQKSETELNLKTTDDKKETDDTDDKKELDNEEKADDEKTDDKEKNVDKNECKDDKVMKEDDKEIGIDEEDRNNIDMMLSGLATDTPELSKQNSEEVEQETTKDITKEASEDDISTGCKRKRTDSPDVSSSPEKKKKKVTFADGLGSSE